MNILSPLLAILLLSANGLPDHSVSSDISSSAPSRYSHKSNIVVEFEQGDSGLHVSIRTFVIMEDTDGKGIPVDEVVIPVAANAAFDMETIAFNGRRLASIAEYAEEPVIEDVFVADGKIYTIPNPNKRESTKSITYKYRLDLDDVAYLPLFYVPNVFGSVDYDLQVIAPAGFEPGIEVFQRGDLTFVENREDAKKTTSLSVSFTSLDYRYDRYIDSGTHEHATIRILLKKDGKTALRDTPNLFTSWYLKQLESPLFDSKLRQALTDYSGDRQLLALRSLLTTDPDYLRVRERIEAEHSMLRGRKKEQQVTNAIDEIAAAYLELWQIKERVQGDGKADIKALYEWAQNIRYVADHSGGHSIVPRQAAEILSTGYGDCKDRASVLASLLKMAGYDAFLVLVNTQDQFRFDAVRAGDFDHMITGVRIDDRTLYLDPTARYAPYGTLPAGLAGRKVLHLEQGNAKWSYVSSQSQPEIAIEIEGSSFHSDSMRAVISFSGNQLGYVNRVLSRFQNDLAIENSLASFINEKLFLITLKDFAIESQSDSLIVASALADASDFFIRSNRHVYVPKLPLTVDSNSLNRWSSNRGSVDLEVLPNLQVDLKVEMDGKLLEDQSAVIEKRDIGLFEYSASEDTADTVRFSYRYSLDRLIFDAETEVEFTDFLSEVAANRNEVFVLKRGEMDD